MMKQKKHRKIPALAAGTTLVAAMPLMDPAPPIITAVSAPGICLPPPSYA